MTVFSSDFITEQQTAFTELVTLGSTISQRAIQGKESIDENNRAGKIIKTLEALDCADLTTKEQEALQYQLNSMLTGQFTPTVNSIYSV